MKLKRVNTHRRLQASERTTTGHRSRERRCPKRCLFNYELHTILVECCFSDEAFIFPPKLVCFSLLFVWACVSSENKRSHHQISQHILCCRFASALYWAVLLRCPSTDGGGGCEGNRPEYLFTAISSLISHNFPCASATRWPLDVRAIQCRFSQTRFRFMSVRQSMGERAMMILATSMFFLFDAEHNTAHSLLQRATHLPRAYTHTAQLKYIYEIKLHTYYQVIYEVYEPMPQPYVLHLFNLITCKRTVLLSDIQLIANAHTHTSTAAAAAVTRQTHCNVLGFSNGFVCLRLVPVHTSACRRCLVQMFSFSF